jgi:hypothetical protein
MTSPLMPKATAVWLVENTALTFQQIADFCGLHELEVQAIADEEIVSGMSGLDPVLNGQLTKEEIDRCQKDPQARLQIKTADIPLPVQRAKGARYTPIAKRQDKPDGIAWLLKFHPELTDAQISKLLGTTKSTITAVRDRTHWNSSNIRARDPVDLGLCTYTDMSIAVEKARARLKKEGKEIAAPEAPEGPEAPDATLPPQLTPTDAS